MLYIYMLVFDSKTSACLKALRLRTYLKPSKQFRSRVDGLVVVQTASKPSVQKNAVTKPSTKPASKLSLPVVQRVLCSQCHNSPLHIGEILVASDYGMRIGHYYIIPWLLLHHSHPSHSRSISCSHSLDNVQGCFRSRLAGQFWNHLCTH